MSTQIQPQSEPKKRYFELMRLLVLYKFGNVGTAESTANEIYNIFNSQETKSPQELRMK